MTVRSDRRSPAEPGSLRLVLDGGKSKTDAVVVDASGTVLASARGPGLPIIDEPGGVDGVRASLGEVAGLLDATDPFHTVCIGLNGVIGAGEQATLRSLQAVEATWPAARYIVTSDVVTSFIGALGLQPGVVVAAGTGSVIMALGTDGVPHHVDGLGPQLGDRGSGYDVGRQGLVEAFKHADGVPGSAALHADMIDAYGGVAETMLAVEEDPNPVRLIASFSRAVARAASAGDPVSAGIWERAGRDLAEGAAAAARAAGLSGSPHTVATTGGLFQVGPLLGDPFARALRQLEPGARVREAAAGALAGGIALATTEEPVLTEVVSWFGGPRAPQRD